MTPLQYLSGYPQEITQQVQVLIDNGNLTKVLLNKYPRIHSYTTEKALYDYVIRLKNQSMKKSAPISKVIYDGKIATVHKALGLHSYVTRVQGGKLKSKNEIRIGTVFKHAPEEFLKMIVVHELAHIKEKDHNKAFYQLCQHMEPNYHQLEFDTRLYLTHLNTIGPVYT